MDTQIADCMIGLVAGAGVLVPLGRLSFSVEGRYALSFTSIYLPSFYDFDQRQSAVDLSVGLGLNLLP
jgi:hypothetical protein